MWFRVIVAVNGIWFVGVSSLNLQAQERMSIEWALERFGGNRKEAAEALNISTVTLWRRMKQ